MQSQQALTKDEIAIWTWLVSRGIANALSGLSEMVGKELSVTSIDLKHFPAKYAADLLGGPENLVVGIYLTIHGDATGHLMLVHEPKMAFELIDIQMGLVSGTTHSLEEMERSVMGEMGNITGSFFLNALADATNMTLAPSPPAVLIDMAGAILGIALTEILQEQDDILVIRTTFGTENRQVNGTFLVMPTMNFLRSILEHSRAPWK
jgi:chemotaxis protein CheC